MNFDPSLAELVRSGATATLLLDGVKRLCDLCSEVVLKKMDTAMLNGKMTSELALSLVSELTAYRQIVYRQRQEIEQGRAAEKRAEGN